MFDIGLSLNTVKIKKIYKETVQRKTSSSSPIPPAYSSFCNGRVNGEVRESVTSVVKIRYKRNDNEINKQVRKLEGEKRKR